MTRQAALLARARAGAAVDIAELYTALALDDTSGYPWPTWEELSLARRRWWAKAVTARLSGLELRVTGLEQEGGGQDDPRAGG